VIVDHILSRYRSIINIVRYIVTEFVIVDHILSRSKVIDFYRLWALSVTSNRDVESLPFILSYPASVPWTRPLFSHTRDCRVDKAYHLLFLIHVPLCLFVCLRTQYDWL
jgi:hypothetical protein